MSYEWEEGAKLCHPIPNSKSVMMAFEVAVGAGACYVLESLDSALRIEHHLRKRPVLVLSEKAQDIGVFVEIDREFAPVDFARGLVPDFDNNAVSHDLKHFVFLLFGFKLLIHKTAFSLNLYFDNILTF